MIGIATRGIVRGARMARQWQERLDSNFNRLVRREAEILRGDIVRGIRAQAPGGDRFEPLADATVAAKGSSKALIDRGDLIGSINVSEFEGGRILFVGVNRSEQDDEGNMLEDIAVVHEFGTAPGSQAYVPERPFLRPSFREWVKVAPKRFEEALRKAMGL